MSEPAIKQPPVPATSTPPPDPVLAAPTGRALLVFAGTPDAVTLATMVACAENLGLEIVTASVGDDAERPLATAHELSRATAEARRVGAEVLVVESGTAPLAVRRLASAARRPVLVARTRQAWQRVMAATDLQSRGAPIIETGADLAARRHASLTVIHNVAPGWAEASRLDRTGAARAHVGRRLRRLANATCKSAPDADVMIGHAGAPEQAVIEAGVARGADVVVVGMRRPRLAPRARCADHIVATMPGNVIVVPLLARRRARVEARA